MILKEISDFIKNKYISRYENLTVERLQVGIFLSGVQLFNGLCDSLKVLLQSDITIIKALHLLTTL